MKLLDKREIEDILALTPMQEGMLFYYLKNPLHHVEQLSLGISGKISVELFEKAWNFVIETNDMLRTTFRWEKVEKPIQIILKTYHLQPGYYDITGINSRDIKERKKRLEQIKDKDRKKKFDLKEIPFRVILCKIEADQYEMMVSHHHILYDGWSTGIILKEFFDAYKDLSNRKELVKPVKTKFKEFIKWIGNQDQVEGERYWRKYLEGLGGKAPLLPDRKRKPKEMITAAGSYHFRFGPGVTGKSRNFVKSHHMTLASLIYSAWGLVVLQCNGGKGAVFDATESARPTAIKGIENVVGLFIDTLPVRVQTDWAEGILDFLHRMHRMLQEREKFGHIYSPGLKELIERCRKHNLLDSLLVIENYPLQENLVRQTNGLTVHSYSYAGITPYDLTVIITVFKDITLHITYNTRLFDKELPEQLARQFISILEKMVTVPGQKVSELAGLPGEVKERLLNSYKMNRVQPESGYDAPRDRIEEKLAVLWAELFRIDASTVSIDANFFDLGGHSLSASLLAARVQREFRVRLPLAEIFNHPTIRHLSGYIRESAGKRRTTVFIEPSEKKEYYVLSSAARRIFMLRQVHRESTAYNGLWMMVMEGKPDKNQVEKSFARLINRHESLRTSFIIAAGQPVQRIQDEVKFEMEHYDFQVTGAGDRCRWNEDQFSCLEGTRGLAPLPLKSATALISSFIRPFDLSCAPLFRVGLVKINDEKYILLVDMHHIITDGVSTGILIREFAIFYAGGVLPSPLIHYKDFSEWQTKQIRSGKLETQKEYWLNRFQGELPVLNMPIDYPRPPVQSMQGEKIKSRWEKQLQHDLQALLEKTGTTLYMVLMAVLSILLNKYTDQDDIIIGSPFAGRDHPALENMVGLVVETLVIRNYPSGEKTFIDFLQEVKRNVLAAYENQPYPYRELIRQLGLKSDLSRNPLFDVMLNVRDREKFDSGVEGVRFTPQEVDRSVALCDLVLEAFNREEGTGCTGFELEYCPGLFKRESMERFCRFFINIMTQVVRNPALRISQVKMLSREEEKQINQTSQSRLAADFDF